MQLYDSYDIKSVVYKRHFERQRLIGPIMIVYIYSEKLSCMSYYIWH